MRNGESERGREGHHPPGHAAMGGKMKEEQE